MKKAAMLLLSCLLLLSGCAAVQSQTGEGETITLYYISDDSESGSALRTEQALLEENTIPRALDLLLREATLADGQTRTFPVGTQVLDWSVEDGVLYLDLSEEFERLTNIRLTEAEYCIVMTVTQFDAVDALVLTVGGKTLPGAGSHMLTAQDVILVGEIRDPILVTLQLFFPLADGSGIAIEARECEVEDVTATARAEAVLAGLVNGPAGSDMAPFLSGATKLEIESISNGLCIVDLDSETMELICTPMERYELSLYSIVDSLAQLEEIDSVSFTLNHQPIENWEEQYQMRYPY